MQIYVRAGGLDGILASIPSLATIRAQKQLFELGVLALCMFHPIFYFALQFSVDHSQNRPSPDPLTSFTFNALERRNGTLKRVAGNKQHSIYGKVPPPS